MIRNDSHWVTALFAANLYDWTPPSAQNMACVFFMPVMREPGAVRRCTSLLSKNELQRADRFLNKNDKNLFIQRRAFRRYCGALALGSPQHCLSQIVFDETEKGRPYLPDLPEHRFSFSSCQLGFLGSWSTTHEIGIDFEDQTQDLPVLEIAQRFFSKDEVKMVEEAGGPARTRTFFQLWSLKEAALKSIGEGLPFGLDAFKFELSPDLRVVDAPGKHGGKNRFEPYMIEKNGGCATLIIREA